MKRNKSIKKILSIVICLALVMSYVPMVSLNVSAEDNLNVTSETNEAVVLPTTLFVSQNAVVLEGVVQNTTSGTGWSFDSTTGTLCITEGALLHGGKSADDTTAAGIYCEGDLNVITSGTVTIKGVDYGINMVTGTLKLHVQSGTTTVKSLNSGYGINVEAGAGDLYIAVDEHATLNISGYGSGILSRNNGNIVLSGKGKVSCISSTISGYGISTKGTLKIDGIALDCTGRSNYPDIGAANIIIGESAPATVNFYGVSKGLEISDTVSILNGSVVTIGAKSGDAWIYGIYATTINVVDSTVKMDTLAGTSHTIYGIIGTLNVSGSSHILGSVSSTHSSRGFVDGTINVEGNYYYRTDRTAEFQYNTISAKKGVDYFELVTESHLGYIEVDEGHNYGCRNTSCVCSVMILENEAHTAEEGAEVCSFCGAYMPATQNEDGYYEIGNAGQLLWFAQLVNNGETSANAILMADIDMDGIGTWSIMQTYDGTLDGNGYTIQGLNQNAGLGDGEQQGFIRRLTGTVKNTTFKNCSAFQQDSIGCAIIAYNNSGTISGCMVVGCNVQLGNYGGLALVTGRNLSGGVIENCGVVGGNITRRFSGINNQGMAAITEQNGGTVQNCFAYGFNLNSNDSKLGALVYSGNAPVNSYYYYSGDKVFDSTVESIAKTAEQFASGEVAYLLQQGNTEQVWGQDSNQSGATPILDSTGLYKVVTIGSGYSVSNVGDTNGDGTIDATDYQVLVNEILSESNEQIETAGYDDIVKYDLDGNGYLNAVDASVMERMINGHIAVVDVYAVGDYDMNGVAFEEADLSAIKHAIGNPEKLSTAEKYACDINGDGKVSEADLIELTDIYGEIASEAHIFSGNKCKICGFTRLNISDVSKTVYYNDNDNKLDLSTLFTLPEGAGNVTYELVSGAGTLDGSTLNIVLQGTEKIKVTVAETENYTADEFEITVTVEAPKGSGSFDGEWVTIG